jgi:hypothetical protein
MIFFFLNEIIISIIIIISLVSINYILKYINTHEIIEYKKKEDLKENLFLEEEFEEETTDETDNMSEEVKSDFLKTDYVDKVKSSVEIVKIFQEEIKKLFDLSRFSQSESFTDVLPEEFTSIRKISNITGKEYCESINSGDMKIIVTPGKRYSFLIKKKWSLVILYK